MTSEFVRIENHLSQLESLRREHYLVEKNYLEMVWLHDPERALGTLQTFYAQHEDDAFVAALLVYWLAKSGQREKAFALMNRFRLPDERTAAAMLPDWMMACVPFLSEEVKTKLPEAHRRAKEIYDAIMSTWRGSSPESFIEYWIVENIAQSTFFAAASGVSVGCHSRGSAWTAVFPDVSRRFTIPLLL